MKKNVLFVLSSGLITGGVPFVTMDIVRALSNDFHFDIICCDGDEKYESEFLSYGGTITKIKYYDYKHRLRVMTNGQIITKSIIELSKHTQYNVIHCENEFFAGPALKVAKECNIPIRIEHVHGMHPINGKNILYNTYRKNCKKLISKYSTVRLACSNVAGESIFDNDFLDILNPIKVYDYQKIEKKEHDELNLLQIGYFCNRKNQLFTLKIIEELRNEGILSRLYLVGYDNGSGYFKLMQSYIEENQLENVITVLQPDYSKEEIFAISDFLLLPSLDEGLPLVTLEAQSANVQTIASDNVSREIDMGICGFLPIDSAKLWAKYIIANHRKVKADPKKLASIEHNMFMNKIRDIYNGKIK